VKLPQPFRWILLLPVTLLLLGCNSNPDAPTAPDVPKGPNV